MKRSFFKIAVIYIFCICGKANGAIVIPVVQDYGDVFPTLSDVVLQANRTSSNPPWFVRFNLLTAADVGLGVRGVSSGTFGTFTVTSLRITPFDDATQTIAFGTDTFSVNPFSSPIDQLVLAPNLALGTYALAVSGTGDVNTIADFFVHLQVMPPTAVPVPAAAYLFVSGILGLIVIGRKTIA